MLAAVAVLVHGAEQEAPNPILPATNEIVVGALAFLIVFFVLWKMAFPAIKTSMQARADKIRADLDAAESQKNQAQQVLDEYQRQLSDARNEAGRIIEEARRAADDLRRDLMAKAESEAAELRQRAQADIDATVARAKADLQREVASFAVTIAERVVERNLDRDAQLGLIERYINEVGGMGAAAGSNA